MKKVAVFAGRTRKAIGTGIAGVYAWAGLVIQSGSASITAAEWYVLMGVGVAVAACYGLSNDAPVEPAGSTYLVGEGGAEAVVPLGDQQHP